MRTMARLNRAYHRAKVIEIDSSSKFVIFSDSHRGDGSHADEFRKDRSIFEAALSHYLAEGFTLIEAGDSDDLWEYPKFHHIVKANADVFALLRRFHTSGRYLRLYGNHDMDLRDPQYVRDHLSMRFNQVTGEPEPMFDGIRVHEGVLLRHKNTDQETLIVHGHQGDFPNDQAWKATRFTFRVFWRHLHALGFHSPSSPTRSSYKRHKVERNYARWILQHGTALICGHTHRARFPQNDEALYFNAGSCIFPDYITGLEIVDDTIALVGWRIMPDANGYLKVLPKVLAGPMPLEDLKLRPDPSKHRRPHKAMNHSLQILQEAVQSNFG